MSVYLNQYSIVALADGSTMNVEQAGKLLNIRIDIADSLLLLEAVQRGENRVGFYNGSMFLCTQDDLQFFHEPASELAERLLRSFPSSKWCAVCYYSITDLYGYAYFEGGKPLRIKHGALNEVWVDQGCVLPVEAHKSCFGQMQEKLVEQVTGEELSVLLGHEIMMMRFDLIVD